MSGSQIDGSQASHIVVKSSVHARWVKSVLIIATLALLAMSYPPLSDFVFRLEGEIVRVDRPDKSIEAKVGESVSTSFSIRNISARPITVYGVETSCGCVRVTNLPLAIPAGRQRDLVFRVQTRPEDAEKQILEHDAQLVFDVPSPPVRLRFTVKLVKIGSSLPGRDRHLHSGSNAAMRKPYRANLPSAGQHVGQPEATTS